MARFKGTGFLYLPLPYFQITCFSCHDFFLFESLSAGCIASGASFVLVS